MTPATINIDTAEQAGDSRIRLRFDDGTEQTVDFKPFLARALHHDIRAWLDPARFATFRIEYGELVWGDYDLCFPVIDLYRNQILSITHRLRPWLEHDNQDVGKTIRARPLVS